MRRFIFPCLVFLTAAPLACEGGSVSGVPAPDAPGDAGLLAGDDLGGVQDTGAGTVEGTGEPGALDMEAGREDAGEDARTDDLGEADGGVTPGGKGWPCLDNSECLSGWCVETPDGQACTTLCADGTSCDDGFRCAQVATYPDVAYACVHVAPRDCWPCRDDADCRSPSGGLDMTCGTLGGHSFCMPVCETDPDCPGGSTCQDLAGAGAAGRACIHAAGACACPRGAISLASRGRCRVENEHGACEGEFVCSEDGIGPCDGPVPAPEACNGEDDDCDGETDEEFLAGPCELSNVYGTCAGVQICRDGEPVCEGTYALPEVCNGIDDDCEDGADDTFPDLDVDGVADCVDPDVDGDGVANGEDRCPVAADPGQLDTDEDGEGDACDPDDDGDGEPDAADLCPLQADPGQADTDHDGLGDLCDSDIDGDEVGNAEDLCPLDSDADQTDTDKDGDGDACDEDDDGDGVPDTVDLCRLEADPAQGDLDHDGLGDACDPDVDGDGVVNGQDSCPLVANPQGSDIDHDGLGDECDPDVDEDGVPNGDDLCPEVFDPGQEDKDGDGIGDACQSDWDGDGVANGDDDCPWGHDPKQEDLDGDGEGDRCDCDIDGDGVANPGPAVTGLDCPVPPSPDRCAHVPDPGQEDLDGDGLGDACDSDRDGDKDPDASDCAPLTSAIHHGAAEACNEVDDDCDGAMDEEGAAGCLSHYWDADLDGYGTLQSRCLCAPVAPHTAPVAGDCDDKDPAVNPAASEACGDFRDNNCDGRVDEPDAAGCLPHFRDADVDGYGGPGAPMCLCSPWGGFNTTTPGDCNDADRMVFPGATEVCNGKDDDCDGAVDPTGAANCKVFFLDGDRDGFGVDGDTRCLCVAAAPYDATKGGDCDDADPGTLPGGPEACNGHDDDCDGAVDEEGAGGCAKTFLDADQDGYGLPGAFRCLCSPQAPYSADNGTDCSDTDPAVNPGAMETCNGIDDDCDGKADEPDAASCNTYWRDGDLDGYGADTDTACLCAPAAPYSATRAGDCDDTNNQVFPGATEFCNGKDEDCDAVADEGTNGCGGVCPLAHPRGEACDGGDADGCLDDRYECAGPNATECPAGADNVETCNNLDDDCDGAADEGDNACGGVCPLANPPDTACDGPDLDECADDRYLCSGLNGTACSTGADNPDTCNGSDDDCDGTVDEGTNLCGGACPLPDPPGTACDGPDADQCADDKYVCDGLNATTCSAGGENEETCNGKDDDCDGTVDEGGNACGGACTLANPPGGACDGADSDRCADDLYECAGLNATACSTGTDQVETCNHVDDDCDGTVDEGTNPCGGVCQLANPPGTPCDGPDSDACTDDAYQCTDINETTCSTGQDNAETCNGFDDDCDGTVDEGGNACGGACTLANPPGGACDGPDGDLCKDDVWQCSGLNATECSTGAYTAPTSTVHGTGGGSCNGQTNRVGVITACGCPTVEIVGAFYDHSDGSGGQVTGASNGSNWFQIQWDDSPAGGDCDLDIRSYTSWTVTQSGTTLTVTVSNSINGYDAGNSLSAGYSITNHGTFRWGNGGSDTRSFSFTCTP